MLRWWNCYGACGPVPPQAALSRPFVPKVAPFRATVVLSQPPNSPSQPWHALQFLPDERRLLLFRGYLAASYARLA
jgi:hypothetical protein